MIARLRGILLERQPDHVVLDIHGVGYHVWITVNTYERLAQVGEEATLLIHHQIREDGQDLFGFIDDDERLLFRKLISVSGIGAKTASTFLSGAQPGEFIRRIQEEDEDALTAIRGVGPKMARRIITELKDKLAGIAGGAAEFGGTAAGKSSTQAVESLMALGYKQGEAISAVRSAANVLGDQATVENLIRTALSGTK